MFIFAARFAMYSRNVSYFTCVYQASTHFDDGVASTLTVRLSPTCNQIYLRVPTKTAIFFTVMERLLRSTKNIDIPGILHL